MTEGMVPWKQRPRITDEEKATHKLVYQSGHGDVWCDGERHIWTYGGWVQLCPEDVGIVERRGRCDCAHWTGLGSPSVELKSNNQRT